MCLKSEVITYKMPLVRNQNFLWVCHFVSKLQMLGLILPCHWRRLSWLLVSLMHLLCEPFIFVVMLWYLQGKGALLSLHLSHVGHLDRNTTELMEQHNKELTVASSMAHSEEHVYHNSNKFISTFLPIPQILSTITADHIQLHMSIQESWTMTDCVQVQIIVDHVVINFPCKISLPL